MVSILVVGFALALGSSVAQAQGAPPAEEGEIDVGEDGTQNLPPVNYAITVREDPDEAAENHYVWETDSFQAPAGSRIMLIYDSTDQTAPHNVHVTEGAAEAGEPSAILNPNEGRAATWFVMPEEGEVTFVCDVHPTDMVATFSVGTFGGGAGGGAEGEDITHVGVHFLAHWVGVISFALLFIVYGATFFLFKYNETPFTTDHKDRATPAGAGGVDRYGQDVRVTRQTATIIGLILLAFAVALVWAFTQGWFAPVTP